MENTVTMNLKDYEKLIKENVELKTVLKGLKKKAEERVEDIIRDGEINRLSSEQCKELLSIKNENAILSQLTSAYSWSWKEIASQCYILTEEEVKKIALEKIACRLSDRLVTLYFKRK